MPQEKPSLKGAEISPLSTPAVVTGALAQALRVQHALLMRDMLSRFGESRLGFLSFVVEPSIYVLVIILFRTYIGSGVTPFGVDAPLYVVTGVIPCFLFRACLTRTADAGAGAKAILFMPEVMLLDVYPPKILLETALYFTLLFGALALLALFGHSVEIENMPGVLFGVILAAILGGGFGMLFAVLISAWQGFKALMNLVSRVIFMTSGIFFSISNFPYEYRKYVLWNPVLYITEYVRSEFFHVYASDLPARGGMHYVYWCAALSWLIGIPLVRRMRGRILQR